MHLVHAGGRQAHLAAQQLALGLGNFAQLQRFGQPGFALDKAGGQGPRSFFQGLLERIDTHHGQVGGQGQAEGNPEGLAGPAQKTVEI